MRSNTFTIEPIPGTQIDIEPFGSDLVRVSVNSTSSRGAYVDIRSQMTFAQMKRVIDAAVSDVRTIGATREEMDRVLIFLVGSHVKAIGAERTEVAC